MTRRTCRAFTLVEMLVVIAIIGVLVALLLPALSAARNAAHNTQCKNNLKQLSTGLIAFHENKRRLPRYWDNAYGLGTIGLRGNWFVQIFPFIEEQNLYDEICASGPLGGYKDVVVQKRSPDYNPGRAGSPGSPGGPKRVEDCSMSRKVWDDAKDGDIEPNVGHVYEFPPPPPTYHWEPPCGTKVILVPPSDPVTPIPPTGKPEIKKRVWAGVDAFSDTVFQVLLCPADPSTDDGKFVVKWPSPWPLDSARAGKEWSVSNYQPNWHAFSAVAGDARGDELPPDPPNTKNGPLYAPGAHVPPATLERMIDGTGMTILLAEAYAKCNRANRLAMWGESDWKHNNKKEAGAYPAACFGLNWNSWKPQDPQGREGIANSTTPANTYMYQHLPPKNKCVDVRIQGMHPAGLNVAMADGSVRTIAPDITRQEETHPVLSAYKGGAPVPIDMRAAKVDNSGNPLDDLKYGVWDRLMLPRDGLTVEID